MLFPIAGSINEIRNPWDHESVNEAIQWILIRNAPHLQFVIVEGDGYIARVAYKVNNARITRIERFVTLQHSTTTAEYAVGILKDVRHNSSHIRESNGLVLSEISN
jgi:hypothetical protein